jgi:hypothetical protein
MKHGLERLNRQYSPVEVTGLDEAKVVGAAHLVEMIAGRLWRSRN